MLPVAYLVFDKVMKLTSDGITIMSLPTSLLLSIEVTATIVDSEISSPITTPILQPSSVWQHPRGDIHFKTGITEPYSLGMYFIYF
jgi:hypothetical protein